MIASILLFATIAITPQSEIVLATNAPYATRLAAEELNFFMKGVFGEALPVVAEQTPGHSAIVLGTLPSDAFETNASTKVAGLAGEPLLAAVSESSVTCGISQRTR